MDGAAHFAHPHRHFRFAGDDDCAAVGPWVGLKVVDLLED
jgi:hypothetical protein